MSSGTSFASSLAGRYSSALFELADTDKVLDQIAADLATLKSVLVKSKDLKRVMGSPVISLQEQKFVMLELLEKLRVNDLVTGFVCIVLQNRRLTILAEIISEFQSRLALKRGEIVAEVSAPQKLSEYQIKGIAEAIKKATKKQISIVEKVDTELLGGVIVKIGSQMVDNSLRMKLDKLHLAMKGDN